MSRTPSRANAAGVSAAKMRRQVERFADRAREALGEIASAWDELDGSVDFVATQLSRQVDDFEKVMLERVAWAKKPIGDES